MYVPSRGIHCYRLHLVKNGIFEYDKQTGGWTDCAGAKFEATKMISAVKSIMGNIVFMKRKMRGEILTPVVERKRRVGNIVIKEDVTVANSGGAEMNLVAPFRKDGKYEIDLLLTSCA